MSRTKRQRVLSQTHPNRTGEPDTVVEDTEVNVEAHVDPVVETVVEVVPETVDEVSKEVPQWDAEEDTPDNL